MKELNTKDVELVPIDGKLIAHPVPDISTEFFDEMGRGRMQKVNLCWQFQVGNLPELSAGTAKLAPPVTGVRIMDEQNMNLEFDYSNPGRLIRAQIGFGTAIVDRSSIEHPSRQMLEQGTMGRVEKELLKLALGQETIRQLELQDRFHGFVQVNDEWPKLGRLAVLQSQLNRRDLPLDGLWALEAAVLFHELGDSTTSAIMHSLVQKLIRTSEPALKVLSATSIDWLGSATEPTRDLFQRAKVAGAKEFGPLGRLLLDQTATSE